VEILC
jgi:hypothetical protein